jgi:nucleoside phosphorylase
MVPLFRGSHLQPDILIVTALKMEFEALLEAAKSMSATPDEPLNLVERDAEDPARYFEFDYVPRQGSPIKLAVSYPDRMSSLPANSLTSALIERLKPRCIAMCGVCAGNPGDVALGDVIFAEITYQYDEGKRAETFLPDHRQSPLKDPNWLRFFRALKPDSLPSYGDPSERDSNLWFLERVGAQRRAKDHPARRRYISDDVWQSRVGALENDGLIIIKDDDLELTQKGRDLVGREFVLGVPPKRLPFSIQVGPIASGNAVVKDGVTWDSLKTGCPECSRS